MDCCSTKYGAPPSAVDAPRACSACEGASRAVTRKTMLLMLKPEAFDRIGEGFYRFCASAECRVVYFPENGGESFTTDDLRVRVGLKETSDPIPLCYCFGFDEADLREEIKATGDISIPQRIASLVKQGMCACDDRNPSGACCLGAVTKAAKRLMSEATQ
ncbi:MAG: putative iron-sulfur cluster-binding metallochaperone [Blastocatellia bacterium]